MRELAVMSERASGGLAVVGDALQDHLALPLAELLQPGCGRVALECGPEGAFAQRATDLVANILRHPGGGKGIVLLIQQGVDDSGDDAGGVGEVDPGGSCGQSWDS